MDEITTLLIFVLNIVLTTYMVRNAATDPKRILCCFRAVLSLLLASCVFLVFSCMVLDVFLFFPVGFLVCFWGFLAVESGA